MINLTTQKNTDQAPTRPLERPLLNRQTETGSFHDNNDNNSFMEWSAISIPRSPKDHKQTLLIILTVYSLVIAKNTWLFWETFSEERNLFLGMIVTLGIFSLFCALIARQKYEYKYTVDKNFGQLEYVLYFSKSFNTTFKVAAVLAIILILTIVTAIGSTFLLVGPVAIALMAALRLLRWQNPVKDDRSLLWTEYNFVTVDRKQRIIVAHTDDPTLGFEARLPDDVLFEQYLQFLRSALPPTAEYTEKRWELSRI